MTSTRTSTSAALAALLLALPTAAAAVPANRSIALETALADRGGAPAPAFTLAAGCWLEGEVEALARLTLGPAPRTEGRGAAGAVTPEVGLRWAPDQGRWRPALAVGVGVRLPVAGRATAASGLLQAGVERLLGSGWAVAATAGVRWLAGERAAREAAPGARLYF